MYFFCISLAPPPVNGHISPTVGFPLCGFVPFIDYIDENLLTSLCKRLLGILESGLNQGFLFLFIALYLHASWFCRVRHQFCTTNKTIHLIT